jgi:hypothetical protein
MAGKEPDRIRWRSLALDVEGVLGPWARLAVAALCEEMGRPLCYVSIPRLARRMGTGERLVYDAIAELERAGFLVIERRAGVTNLYHRDLPPLHDMQGSGERTPAQPLHEPLHEPLHDVQTTQIDR